MLSAEDTPTRMKNKRYKGGEEESLSDGDGDLFNNHETTTSTVNTDSDDAFTQAKSQMAQELRRVTGSSRFNPHPDEQEVIQLRQGYSRLLHTIRAERTELLKPDDNKLEILLDDANQLLTRVHTTIDATLDSRFMALSAELEAERINKLSLASLDFSVGDLCSLIKTALTRPTVDLGHLTLQSDEAITGTQATLTHHWEPLQGLTLKVWRGVTTLDSMAGALVALPSTGIEKPPPRTKATRDRTSAQSETIQPTIINEQNYTNLKDFGAETAENVIRVFQALQELAPIPFYQFIVDPISYSRTVENLFYTSFLVHDNRIRLQLETTTRKSNMDHLNDEEWIIHLLNENDNHSAGVALRHQAILNMSIKRWKEMIKRYKLTKPIFTLETE